MQSMRGSLLLLLGASALLYLSGVLAAPREYLFQDERVCDADAVFCFRGTLSYHSNPRLLHLRGRVQTAPGPGLLRISLAGANDLGHRRHAPFEVRVYGNRSEIINHKMIPDHPDVHDWAVWRVEFIADRVH
ncbi:MAG: hypothetical protein ACR2QZ_16250 [Woeseiaceae bacterium]